MNASPHTRRLALNGRPPKSRLFSQEPGQMQVAGRAASQFSTQKPEIHDPAKQSGLGFPIVPVVATEFRPFPAAC